MRGKLPPINSGIPPFDPLRGIRFPDGPKPPDWVPPDDPIGAMIWALYGFETGKGRRSWGFLLLYLGGIAALFSDDWQSGKITGLLVPALGMSFLGHLLTVLGIRRDSCLVSVVGGLMFVGGCVWAVVLSWPLF